jgi:hypothetical protein
MVFDKVRVDTTLLSAHRETSPYIKGNCKRIPHKHTHAHSYTHSHTLTDTLTYTHPHAHTHMQHFHCSLQHITKGVMLYKRTLFVCDSIPVFPTTQTS